MTFGAVEKVAEARVLAPCAVSELRVGSQALKVLDRRVAMAWELLYVCVLKELSQRQRHLLDILGRIMRHAHDRRIIPRRQLSPATPDPTWSLATP